MTLALFDEPISVSARLDANHYLGSSGARGRHVYEDNHGVIVFSGPASRRIPSDWLELSRWCISPGGTGSQQWAACLSWLRGFTSATTIISYSDPSVGHTGALYRACGWEWAPTWHVLRPPPTGAGIRGGKRQEAKHRWVYLLRPDERRQEILSLKDAALAKRFPLAGYVEPKWRQCGRPVQSARADAFRLWNASKGQSK